MAGNDEVRPDDQEKAAALAKKPRARSKSPGTKDDSDNEPVADTMDASSDEESPESETEAGDLAVETVVEKAPKSGSVTPEAPVESKPGSLIHLLRFERKAGKRRR
jgi:hypothetical protein